MIYIIIYYLKLKIQNFKNSLFQSCFILKFRRLLLLNILIARLYIII